MTDLNQYLLETLNERQYEAVINTEGALLILAGAGSGKTRVITHKIQYLIYKGVSPSSILAVTFTNKASKEMKDRVVKLIGAKKANGATITTFHSLGLQILDKEITCLGYREKFSIFDESDSVKVVKDIVTEMKLPIDVYVPYEVYSKINFMKLSLNQINYEDPNIHSIYQQYEKYLKSYNAVDFNDLIKLPIIIFEKYPEILEKYQKKWKYFLVDEYQDTSLMQYKLMKMLAIKTKNISVVGDDDQSIYSWRGANITNIKLFEKDFYPVKEIKLEQNYRSKANILKLANSIIIKNSDRRNKVLWTKDQPGEKIRIYNAKNEEDEADFVISKILSLKMNGYKNSDFGILFRINSQSRPFEEKLREYNLNYKVIGAQNFFERQEIKDILSYMRFIANTEDEVSLSRIINNPKRNIGNATIEALHNHAKETNSSVYSTIKDCVRLGLLGNKVTPYLEDFYNLIEKYRELIFKPKNIANTVMKLVEEIDYQGKLLEETKNQNTVFYKMKNINQLIQSIKNYENNPDNFNPNIYEYLQRVSLTTKNDEEADDDQINLLSIHAAKGLEYKVVFIVGCEDGIIPHNKSIEENNSIEEERRLFYVAVTRAQEILYITYPSTRMKYNEVINTKKSPFLENIPDDIIVSFDYNTKEKDQNDEEESSLVKFSKFLNQKSVKK